MMKKNALVKRPPQAITRHRRRIHPAPKTKRRNPNDLTLRNLHAMKTRVAHAEARVEMLERTIKAMLRGSAAKKRRAK